MDRIIRCITRDGSLMAAAIDTTETAAVAQEIHGLTATTSAVLGRTITAASIMGAMLKQENASITLKFNGGGPVGNVIAISDSSGNVRGYVDAPETDLPVRPDGKLDVGGAVGKNGRLGVIRDYGTGEPYTGQIAIVSGEIAEDITNYYAVSEQIPTVCALGVLTDRTDHRVILSGGLLIQVLPGAYESDIEKLEANVAEMEPMTTMLAKGLSLEEIAETVLKGFEVEKLDETNIHYACTCNKDKYARAILTLGKEEILSLPLQDGNVETVCPYCGSKYYFNHHEIQELAEVASINEK